MIVRLKGVKTVRSKGKTYYYHRKTMTRLSGPPGSESFLSKLRSLDNHLNAGYTVSGTLGALVASYRAGPEFTGLSPRTREVYNGVFDGLANLDKMPLAQVTTEFLYQLRDKKHKERKRSFANMTITVLRLVFAWGKKRQHCKTNPAVDVDLIRKPKNAPVKNRPWRPEELAVVLAEAPEWMRAPVALAAYTGLRSCDVVRVKWGCYDGQAFETRAQKTNQPVWVPAHSRLRMVLDAAPRDHERIVVGARGEPIGLSGVTTQFFRFLRELRAAGKVGPGLSFHGLRHTLGTALAEAGCDPPTIAAVLGQATTQMAEHYSRTANRRGLARAAFDKLENQTENLPVSH